MYLLGLGTYLPKPRVRAEEIAERSGLPAWVVREKLGIREKPVPGPEDHPAEMAVWAAQQALREAGIAPQDVDVVLSITEEYKDYPVWTSGSHIAHRLGARRAWAFDLNQKCASFIAALAVARGLIVTGQARYVLIAGGYRNGDLIDYRDPEVRFMYDLAAGGAAAVLGPEGPGLRVLSTQLRTDASLANAVLVPVGGTREPLTPHNLDRFRLVVTDPNGMKARLEAVSLANFLAVIREALEAAGHTPADLAYLALLHMKRSAHKAVLERLGLREDQSLYLEDYGHLGQLDPILSLKLALERALLPPGGLAALVAAGVGYHWGAAVVRREVRHGA